MSTITGKTAVLSTVAIIIVSNTFVVLVIVAVIVVVICKKFCAKSDNEKFTPTLRQTTHDTGFGYPVTEPDNSHGFENRSVS